MKRADLLASLDIGASIKKLREIKGISQEELAKDICDRTNITKLENGHSKVPSLSFVLLICEKLDISIEEFLNFAMSNSYSLNRKYILDLLLKDKIEDLDSYLATINTQILPISDQEYLKYLFAKTNILTNNQTEVKKLLKELINTSDFNQKNHFLHLLTYHELIKNNYITDDNNHNLTPIKLNNLIDKRTPLEYLYLINDLINISYKRKDTNLMKEYLSIQIQFINSHECYKYLPLYYQNKEKLSNIHLNETKKI